MSESTGWRRDPYRLHEWRRYVDGEPTSSVRDGELLSQDPPPQGPPTIVDTEMDTDSGPAAPGSSVSAPVEEPALLDGPPAVTLEPPPSAPAELLPLAQESRDEERGSRLQSLRRWLAAGAPLLGIYVVVRVGLVVADVLSAHIGFGRVLSGPLLSWDAHWYVQIADHWYPPHPLVTLATGQLTYNAANFLPFFPILIRAVQELGFSPVVAASIVSWVSGAAATLLVWRLGAMAFDEATGQLSAILFVVFPGMGIAWGTLYSECVGLALVAGCLLMLMRRNASAGILGMFATLTSPMAVVPLTAAAVAAAVLAWRREESLFEPLLAVVLTPLGFVGYAVWIGARYNDLLFYWHLGHQVWGTSVDFGHSLVTVLTHPLSQGYLGPGWLNWTGLVAVIGAIVAMTKKRLPAVPAVYTVVVLVQLAMTNVLGFRPRNLTWAFPALISVAALTRHRAWRAVAIGFAVLLPVVFLAYTTIGNTMGAP